MTRFFAKRSYAPRRPRPGALAATSKGTNGSEVSDSSPHTGEDGYLVLPTMPDDDKAVA
jgi:hypothetical protein